MTPTPEPLPHVPVLPPGVAIADVRGTPAIVVGTSVARAVVHLDGAQVTSWIPDGHDDLLWLSPASVYRPGEAIRGGVPLIGPWFGPGRHGDRPDKHGWLRSTRWELVGAEADGYDVVLSLITPPAVTELAARLTVRIGAELALDPTVAAGPEPLELEAALHTYLAVSDVRGIRVGGLGGTGYLDNNEGLAARTQHDELLALDGPTDRVYDAAGPVTIDDPGAGRRIVSTPRGTAKTVVWNPWDGAAAQMADVPDDAWPRFVCVEPAVAKDRFVALAPGESHALGVTYRIQG